MVIRACLPTLKIRILWHTSHHCGGGPAGLLTGHSAPPPQCSGAAAVCSSVCAVTMDSVSGGRRSVEDWQCPLPRHLSALLVLWSRRYELTSLPLGRPTDGTWNYYVTSARLFSADTCWGLRNLMLPMTRRQLQSGGCRQTTNAVDLSCITSAVFCQYHMRVPFEYRPILRTAQHQVSLILGTLIPISS